jgi:hypothetical protein
MKTQINLIIGLLVVLSVSASLGQPASITNFTKSVHYVPPADFKLEDYFRDSDQKDWPADLFKYCGSGVQYGGTILFMLEPSCFGYPDTQARFPGPLFPRSPADLKIDFDKYYHGLVANFTNLPSATIGKTAGYTSVSASTFFTSNNNYFYSCWIQIKSNIVVRVEIETSSKESFDAARNSLKTLKINKKEIMNIVKPSEWHLSQN